VVRISQGPVPTANDSSDPAKSALPLVVVACLARKRLLE
jgi:hypothetical protein